MDRAIAAEWVLRRVVSPERASEMVGDQLEANATSGRLRFWLSVMWLFLVFSWQMLAALVMSVLVGFFFAWQPFAWTLMKLTHSGHRLTPAMFFTSSYLFGLSMLFWSEAGFCFVHFGFRHSLSRISAIAAVFSSLVTCCWWLPHAPVTLASLALGLFVVSMTSRTRRLSLGIWSVVIFLDWLIAFSSLHLQSGAFPFIADWQMLTAVFLVPIVEASVSVALTKRFLQTSLKEAVI